MRFITSAITSVILIVFSSVVFASDSSTPSQMSAMPQMSDSNFSQAQKFINNKEYDKAISLLEKVVSADPKNADAYNLMGYSYRQLGKLDEGIKYYQKALDINPNHKGANEYLGELYLMQGDIPKAEERLQVLEKVCPTGCLESKILKDHIEIFKKKGIQKN